MVNLSGRKRALRDNNGENPAVQMLSKRFVKLFTDRTLPNANSQRPSPKRQSINSSDALMVGNLQCHSNDLSGANYANKYGSVKRKDEIMWVV